MTNRFTQKAQSSLKRALDCAREFGHTYIGSEHLLLGLAGESDSISARLLLSRGGSYEKLRQGVVNFAGVGSPTQLTPGDMTPKLKNIIEVSAQESIKGGQSYIGTEHLLSALLSETDCMAQRILISCGIAPGELKRELAAFLDSLPGKKGQREISRDSGRSTISGSPTLSNYGRNLTQLARAGQLDPIIGRERETLRVIQVLSRRRKNNPCLIGEPGVGKTAVVEGLAQRIADGNVPEILRDKIIVTLDIPGMIAGARYRGEFEERMKNVMDEVRRNDSIILFIDEIHTIVGAGAAEGAVDAANIIKPALSRGEMQLIGATTITEYRKHIERDAALERRFQPVTVGEPTAEETVAILRGLRDRLEAHHKLRITDEAIDAAVKLSQRYINDRYLPDKAIDLIDETAAARRISSYASPPSIVAVREKLLSVTSEKEEAIIAQNFELAARLRDEEIALRKQLDEINYTPGDWNAERSLSIGREDIEKTISEWTGIPVTKTDEAESARILGLEKKLNERIIGQEKAVSVVAAAIRRGRSGLRDPGRPAGSFLFCGPTGVGKTELAQALSEEVFGKGNLIRLDMSEYMEKHSVSKLIGSPPGYVGYDEGGHLTGQVRSHPYSVVLFDEIEKAHGDIFNILLQILDNGSLTDSQGRVTDFRNTIVILTSNIGSLTTGRSGSLGFGGVSQLQEEDEESRRINEAVRETFRPEMLNRIDEVVIFRSLGSEDIKKITALALNDVTKRALSLGFTLVFSDSVIELIASRGYSKKYGARYLRRTVLTNIEDRLSTLILEGKIKPGDRVEVGGINEVEITVKPAETVK